MRKSERAEIIRKELKKLYPSPPIPLDHTNAYTLLVAVVLSAQSTDKKVNELTKSLFKVADNPEKMIKLGIKGIYKYIKFLGLSNQKSKNIYKLSKLQKGSSNKIKFVPGARALAIASLCFWPPDSSCGYLSTKLLRPTTFNK